MKFIIIGIGNKKAHFSEELKSLFQKSTFFTGGKRHYDLVKDFLPKKQQWIFIKSPMQTLFDSYSEIEENIIVFASGDPLFYGFANTLKNAFPNAIFEIHPYFSSIHLLANHFHLNKNDLEAVSVHGRDWSELNFAISKQKTLIGVLTDSKNSPNAIAKRLLEYGYSNYKMFIGENIEGETEQFFELDLKSASEKAFANLNCIILQKTENKTTYFGIPDTAFFGLEGRPNMITKMPIRLLSLSLLDISNRKHLWDIGFCTGSISIEAKQQNPNLKISAFEKREECDLILDKNQKKFGVFGIDKYMGDFFEQDLKNIEKPDTIFIGGHGGKLENLLSILNSILPKNGIIVINAVKESSIETFKKSIGNLDFSLEKETTIQVENHNPITLLKAIKTA
ncbi:precorrin-6y C5,15-methyltransferase (decarboxylating) subunit CbiE [Aureivirga sp. CE67]|uniref:precorrin-6y C5,15-methyltransferase (decarboxylating) subunit CbiE n=1 Tax=Aureivirga sp. CE67 TaxID=1788983 RepID=UPI0018CAF15A|nr:precorrin-6y C5,15-methyltransferase (decarboxylating) subunit CbiE [Aureivirga sp. CE67]